MAEEKTVESDIRRKLEDVQPMEIYTRDGGIQKMKPIHVQVAELYTSGHTQNEIAEATGYSYGHIHNILRSEVVLEYIRQRTAATGNLLATHGYNLASQRVIQILEDDSLGPKTHLQAVDAFKKIAPNYTFEQGAESKSESVHLHQHNTNYEGPVTSFVQMLQQAKEKSENKPTPDPEHDEALREVDCS